MTQYMLDEKPIWPGIFGPNSFDTVTANKTLIEAMKPNGFA